MRFPRATGTIRSLGLGFGATGLITLRGIRRRYVDVESAQRPATGVPDFVFIAALDQQQRPVGELEAAPGAQP
jgi:hypothetical protein